MLLNSALSETVVDPRDAAESAGLTYVSDEEPGIRRKKAGTGFTYIRPGGGKVEDEATLNRIRKLAVPPAYTDVWICAKANGHIQATGRDAKGRKQYRYHPRLPGDPREHEIRAHARVRARACRRSGRRSPSTWRCPACRAKRCWRPSSHLLEKTLIRVGNDDYAKQNKSYGLTTLKNQHVEVNGSELRFQFKGKSGKVWRLKVKDRRIAKIVRACQDLPGQELFQYIDEDGERRDVTSSDVNAYLKEITGRDVTAKDFRTWAGNGAGSDRAPGIRELRHQGGAKKNVKAAIETGRLAPRQHADHLPQVLRPSRGALGLRRGPAAPPGQGRGRERALPEPLGSAPGRGRGADFPRSPPEAHAEGQARRQRRAARGRQGRGKDREESLRAQAQIRRPQEAARKGAVGGSRRLNRPPAGGGAFPERRAGS